MNILKKGDRVKVIKVERGDPSSIKIDMIGTVIDDFNQTPFVDFGLKLNGLHNCGGLLELNTGYSLFARQLVLVE